MTANLDTKALRALLKLMENRVRFDDGMESLIAAAPALLDAAEELRSLRAELDVSRSVGSNLYQGAEAVMAERDALKAEVAKAYANAAYHADMAQKLKAEVERLREALKLAEIQEQGCGGNLSDGEALRATLKVIRAALRSAKGEVQS